MVATHGPFEFVWFNDDMFSLTGLFDATIWRSLTPGISEASLSELSSSRTTISESLEEMQMLSGSPGDKVVPGASHSNESKSSHLQTKMYDPTSNESSVDSMERVFAAELVSRSTVKPKAILIFCRLDETKLGEN